MLHCCHLAGTSTTTTTTTTSPRAILTGQQKKHAVEVMYHDHRMRDGTKQGNHIEGKVPDNRLSASMMVCRDLKAFLRFHIRLGRDPVSMLLPRFRTWRLRNFLGWDQSWGIVPENLQVMKHAISFLSIPCHYPLPCTTDFHKVVRKVCWWAYCRTMQTHQCRYQTQRGCRHASTAVHLTA